MSVLENSTCSTAAGAAQWPTAADNLHARNFTAAASSVFSIQSSRRISRISGAAPVQLVAIKLVTNLVCTRSGEGKIDAVCKYVRFQQKLEYFSVQFERISAH